MVVMYSAETDDGGRPLALLEGDDAAVVVAEVPVLPAVGIRVQVDDLLPIREDAGVIPRAAPGGVPDPQRLEENAEEPGEQDVPRHQPGQLLPVLLAVADRHLDAGFHGKIVFKTVTSLKSAAAFGLDNSVLL